MKPFIHGVTTGAALGISVLFAQALPTLEEVKAQSLRRSLTVAIENRPQEKRSTRRPPAENSAGKKGIAYFSAQRPHFPPLPYNPFPELPVYATDDGRLVYDDRNVDYGQLRREGEERAAVEKEAAALAAQGEGGPAQPLELPQGLSLFITRLGQSQFQLTISNLTVGHDYLLTDKIELVNDLRANWAPLFLFTATEPTATFQGPFLEDQDFFLVWDLNAYSGPVINVTEPSAGSTLSGKVKVRGGVADFFADRVAELYVDGDFYRAITNGPLEIELDTQQFGNGTHTLDVVVRTVQFGPDRLEYATVASMGSVTFDNFLSAVDNSPIFSADLGDPTFIFETTGPADYQLDIRNESQNLVRTYTGSTGGGTFQVAWDLLDQNNHPVPLDSGYSLTMTTTSQGPGGGPGQAPPQVTNQVVIKTYGESAFQAGHAYLLYMDFVFNQQPREQVDRNLMELLRGFIGFADLFGPDPVGTRTVLNDQVVQWTSANQKSNILAAIKRQDVGHFFFKGHGDADLFGSGDDTPFQAHIDVADLRLTLTNSYNTAQGTYEFKNPKRYVEIDGCNTGEGDLPLAFGIPKFRIDGRANVRRRTYFGWIGTIEIAAWATEYTQHIQTQNAYWHSVDGDPITIRDALRLAIIAHNFQIDVNQTRLYGSRLLVWPGTIQ